jgi:hypothetical protein
MKLEPKSLSGDCGENIAGGKAGYTIIWDALKDLDELQSAEFLVKAELVKGKATHSKGPNLTGWDKKKFHIFFDFLIPGPKYGIKLGYMGKWGIAAEYAIGKVSILPDSPLSPSDIPGKPLYNLELTKRIVNNNEFQAHLGFGVSMTNLAFSFTQNGTDYTFAPCTGGIISVLFEVKHIAGTLNFITIPNGGPKDHVPKLYRASKSIYIDFGFGVRF